MFNCSFICNNPIISGPETVCNSEIFNVPSGASSYTWSIINGGSAMVVPNGNTATIIRIGQSSGSIIIRVIMNDGGKCGQNIALTKTVWVGIPVYNSFQPIGSQTGFNPQEPNISYSEDPNAGCNQIKFNIIFDSPSIIEYQWEKLTGVVFFPTTTSTGFLTLMPQCNEPITFRVRARNSCGWSDWKLFELNLNRCTMDCYVPPPPTIIGANFVLNPNPVTDGNLNVSIKYAAPWFYVANPNGLTDSDGNPLMILIPRIRVNISVWTQTGSNPLNFYNKTMPTQLDLSTLPQGTYIVIFEYMGQTENYTIIKS